MSATYITSPDIYYPGTMKQIKRKGNSPFQPIFEAFTNAIEAIQDQNKLTSTSLKDSHIRIALYKKTGLFKNEPKTAFFQKFVVSDDGIGFNNEQFNRLRMLRDDRKGRSNKGTGRIQYLHFFDKTSITSIYHDNASQTGFKIREFVLSKFYETVRKNSIIRLDKEEDITANKSSTTLVFEAPLEKSEDNSALSFYTNLTAYDLKRAICRHYLPMFCGFRENMPQITIKVFVDETEAENESILEKDIDAPDKTEIIEVRYSKVDNKKVIVTDRKETFTLKAFHLSKDNLETNRINLVSKDELVSDIKVKFDGMLPNDVVDGKRYLFLISGDYINNADTDARGELTLYTKAEYLKKHEGELALEEEILIDDISNAANAKILSIYPIIAEKRKAKDKDIEDLEKMFLLNHETVQSMKFGIDEPDDEVLRRIYQEDAKLLAKKDAAIRQHFQDIEAIVPTKNAEYQDKMAKLAANFVKDIPLQNRNALSQYVARRQLVLKLFEKILGHEIDKLKSGGRLDESLLHNLIFQQGQEYPGESDIWLISEEYIYFQGCSDKQLRLAKLDGEFIFKEEFSDEEDKYLKSLGEDRTTKKPDILLFPQEGKCIIIEFKAPDENVRKHLTQIDFYTGLIHNFSKEKFNFNTFYGYLIGESINPTDVRLVDGYFEYAEHFDYLFRPSIKKVGLNGRVDANLYTEVIKYSTLLERAKMRNSIFIDKLINEDRK